MDDETHPDLAKVIVNFVPRSVEALDRAAALTGDTRTETINRAVQLWAWANHVLADGNELLLRRRDGVLLHVDWDDPNGFQPASETPRKPEGAQPATFLLFDNERQQWWKPGGWGYTSDPREAGRYSRDEAVKWALHGALGGLDKATVIVAEAAALAAWEDEPR